MHILSKPDPGALQAAIADADLRVLVMCLTHLTGELRWLEPPYRPMRDVRLVADPQAGYPPEVAAEIRKAVSALLARGAADAPAIHDPGDDLLQRMMNVCLGETVPPEYLPMMREDMGFASGDPVWGATPDPDRLAAADVLIVGAGISGLALGRRLGCLGVPYTIVERNPQVGGTWYENRYPGCGVDTPNHFYSYSFAPNHGWKHYFSPREELQAYLERFAAESGVRSNVRFGTEVIAAKWNEADGRWTATLRTTQGTSEVHARVLVAANGHFERPSLPAIKGAETFAGPIFHTACWPDGLQLAGKRVAIIGTGASAMQIVPTIADQVSGLTIYQRSPQWVRPVPEYSLPVKPGTQWLLEHVPYYAIWNRFTLFWRYGDGLLRFLRKDPHWPHPARSLNRINDRHRQEMVGYIESELAQRPDLVSACTPDYPPYGKRILLDKGWFKALCKPNVELVTAPVAHLDAGGIVTADGEHRAADLVVLATGFVVTDLAARLGISGRGGRTLAEDWADENPSAHLGISVPGFPNFFCMYGPNTNMGHGGSVIFLAECQSRYIAACIVEMVERGIATMECTPAARDGWVKRVDEAHRDLVWTHPGMSTYYRNRHGRVVSPSPFRLVDTWAMTHRPDLSDFEVSFG